MLPTEIFFLFIQNLLSLYILLHFQPNTMGKGRRSYTINTPALSLTPPRSSADHSYSVSPPEFLKSHLQNDMLQPSVPESKPTAAQRRNSVAQHKKYDDLEHKLEATPLYVLICTYLNYFLLICFGHLRDILGKIFKRHEYKHLRMSEVSDKTFAYLIPICWKRCIHGYFHRDMLHWYLILTPSTLVVYMSEFGT
jgi:hypothetical protein